MFRALMGLQIRASIVGLAPRLVGATSVILVHSLFAAGCADLDERGSVQPAGVETSVGAIDLSGEVCQVGDVRDCYDTLSRDGDALLCYEGISRCVGGEWGACSEGGTVEVPLPAGLELARSAFLAPSQDCVGNPCNPFCRRFLEVGEPPYQATEGAPVGFLNGDPDSVPAQSSCGGGRGCQDNHFCREPITPTQCSHSKCVTGLSLSTDCRNADTCVNAICTVNPSCCSTSGSWSSACVGLVKTVCDSFCGTPTTVACGHHVCTTGAALTCSNSCVARVCASDSTCCTEAWDSDCVDLAKTKCGSATTTMPPKLPAYSALCGYSLYSYNDLYMGQRGAFTGRVGAGGNLTVTQASVSGVELQAAGNLTIDNSTLTGTATVQGNVYLKNTVKFTNAASPVLTVGGKTYIALSSSVLTGNVVSNNAPVSGDEYYSSGALITAPTWVGTRVAPTTAVTVSRPTIPTKTGLVCSSTNDRTANNGQTLVLPPGNYGTITLNSSSASPAVLSLSEGSYTFNRLVLNAHSRIVFSYGTTGIDINVCNTFTPGNYLSFSSQPSPFNLLRWYYSGTASVNVDLQGGTDAAKAFPGVLIAPNAAVTVAPNTGLQGVIYANSLRVEPGLISVPSTYAASMCGSTSEPFCDPGISMTPNPTVSETGSCEAWELGETDSSCASYDLALGVPCEDSVVVCNHGTAQAPANVRLAFFETTYPWANTSPNLADTAHRGDCYTTSVIAPGQCISQQCDSSLMDRDLEIVAIPPSTVPAECSTLENWAHYFVTTECACFWGEIASADVVAADASTCGVSLGDTTNLDLGAIEVAYFDASGTPSFLTKRSGSTDCGSGGWYWDTGRVVLCSSTCNTLDTTSGARVKIRVGCPSTLSANSVSEIYESDCEVGKLAQWNMLNWTSATPGDSTIRMEVRSARDVASLSSATFHEIGVARNDGSTDTQVCDAFSTSAECPVMFYSLVEQGAWQMADLREPVLELRATLIPSTASPVRSPVLEGWEVQFSCLDSE